MALTLVTSDLIHGLDYSKLTGTIPTWNQNTTGNAATATLAAGATILATARNIGGVSFNGSAAIDLPGVNTAGNQNTSGNAGTVTNGVYTTGNQTIGGVKTFSSAATFNGIVSINGQGFFRGDSSGNLRIQGGTTATEIRNNSNNSSLLTILDGGNVGIGVAPYVYSRLTTEGVDNTSSNYAFIAYKESTDAILACRNDGQVTIPNGNVGIGGISNPTYRIEANTTSGGNGIKILRGADSMFEQFQSTAGIVSLAASGSSGSFSFRTGTTVGTTTPRLTISSGGNVGIGATNTSYKLRIVSDATVNNGIYLSAGSSSSNHILYVENQASSAEYFAVRGDGEIRLNASSGHTYAARGIRFGANSTANNLDDYEEGTWTATMSNDGVGNTATGTYTRIGNLVHVQVWFNGKYIASAGNCRITGLPYSATASTTVGYGIMNYVHGTAINASNGGYIVNNFFDIVQDGATGFMTWNTGSLKDAMFAGTYNIN